MSPVEEEHVMHADDRNWQVRNVDITPPRIRHACEGSSHEKATLEKAPSNGQNPGAWQILNGGEGVTACSSGWGAVVEQARATSGAAMPSPAPPRRNTAALELRFEKRNELRHPLTSQTRPPELHDARHSTISGARLCY